MNRLTKSLKHQAGYRDLLRLLVARDLEVKYKGSFLGYLWSLLDPILMMLVLTVVFSTIFKSRISNYPVYLLSGRIIFTFCSSSGGQAMRSIIVNSALLHKTNVPKYLFPLSKVSSGMTDLIFEMAALFFVMAITGCSFTINLLYIPLILIQAYVFTFGFGLFLCQMAVFFRDTLYVYGVITTAWMYLTPLFYPIESVSPSIAYGIVNYNPIYPMVTNFRNITLYGNPLDMELYLKGWIIALFVLVLGSVTFYLRKDEFLLHI